MFIDVIVLCVSRDTVNVSVTNIFPNLDKLACRGYIFNNLCAPDGVREVTMKTVSPDTEARNVNKPLEFNTFI